MNILKMEGQTRMAGKKETKTVRNAGNVPCVLYGRGQDPVHFQLGVLDMRPLIFTDELHRIELTVAKSSYDCIVRDIDYHPVSDDPIHADFIALQAGQKIKLSVPIQYTGKSAGQTDGGEVEYLLHELEIQCIPKEIPEHIEVDITALNIGDTLHVSDLTIDGIEVLTPERQSLVTVVMPRVEEEVVDELEGLEGEEGEEGEEGAADGEGTPDGKKEDSDS